MREPVFGEPLRVVLGHGERGVQAYREAVNRGGRVFAIAPAGDPLAIEAGEQNITEPGGCMVVIFADEVIDLDEAAA